MGSRTSSRALKTHAPRARALVVACKKTPRLAVASAAGPPSEARHCTGPGRRRAEFPLLQIQAYGANAWCRRLLLGGQESENPLLCSGFRDNRPMSAI